MPNRKWRDSASIVLLYLQNCCQVTYSKTDRDKRRTYKGIKKYVCSAYGRINTVVNNNNNNNNKSNKKKIIIIIIIIIGHTKVATPTIVNVLSFILQ